MQQGRHWRALVRAPRLAILVDLDGTLIEFAPTPEQADLDAEAAQLLRELIDCGVHVVIVSGRPRDSLDPLRGRVPGAWWAAEHGSWRWAPELTAAPERAVPELDVLAERMAALSVPGVRVERKSLSLCIHWRLVDEAARAQLVEAIEIACDEWLEERPAFERLYGVEHVEVRLCIAHKGNVVTWVRQRLFAPRIITLGDDTTDEDMFAELGDGDAAVAVGPRRLHADAHAADVTEARRFLRWVIETRRGGEAELPIAPCLERTQRHRFVVVSHRAPANGETRERGLGAALEPALRDEHGLWLRWSGHGRANDSRVIVDHEEQPMRARFDLPDHVGEPYAAFCSGVLWPLLHGFPTLMRSVAGGWQAYVQANERYARHAMEVAWPTATIWVHDYQLLLVGRALRFLGHRGRVGLFVHVPLPSPDVLISLPWALELVSALCDVDVLGFQTAADAASFFAAVRIAHPRGVKMPEVDVFPATIDPRPLRESTDEAREIANLRKDLGERRLLLGVDRLDHSKGVPERLAAYETLLDRYPEWRRRVVMLQISMPARAEVPEYRELREHVEGMVGRINGRFGDTDWVPVRYLYRAYDQRVLAQLYRLASVAVVTPLRDGMNLVAKEFVAAQDPTHPGVLVLSQYAGAAQALTGALITNPYHADSVASDIDQALRMLPAEREARYRNMAAALEREGDAATWTKRFLDRLAPRRLHAIQ